MSFLCLAVPMHVCRLIFASLLVGFAGCQGAIDMVAGPGAGGAGGAEPGADGGDPGGFVDPSVCDEGIAPGPRPLRRLTRAQFDATVADLLGDETGPGSAFPPEGRSLNFRGIADAQTVSPLLVESFQNVAEQVAARAVGTDAAAFLGCDPGAAGCVDGFVRDFGLRAYRRPLESDEVDGLLAVYTSGLEFGGPAEGVQMILEVVLQSPDFLYRPEMGAESVAPGVRALSSYEMATRLSFFFTGSTPDEALLEAARLDRLKDLDDIAAQAERLLARPEARAMFVSFHGEWLNLDGVEHIQRDPVVHSGFHAGVPQLLRQETERFVEHVLFEGEGTLRALFTANYTLANRALADFYGLKGPTGDDFELLPLPRGYAGLVTQAGMLAHHSQGLSTSPVARGKFVRETFFCQTPPPPPPDLVIRPPDLDPNLTTRERYAQHSADPSCVGCHRLMDPVGLTLEHFDPSGRYRGLEQGLPIDATGELVQTDVNGPMNGAVDLANKLADSEQVASCVSRQWLRFAMGRSETPEDACTLATIQQAFVDSGGDLRSFARAIVETDAFLYLAEVDAP